jgi:hypothetical protein
MNTGTSSAAVLAFGLPRTPANPTFTTLTNGATVTWAVGSAIAANALLQVTPTTTINVTGLVSGGSYVLVLSQSGGVLTTTIGLGSGCTWFLGGSTGFVASSSVTMAATSSSGKDILAFTFDGTNCYANFR